MSASSEVLPEISEYERLSTTAVDAYLTPVLRSYLERPGRARRRGRLPAPAIMQSSGGVLPIEASAEHAAWTVLSGPAGGVIGAARLAAREGAPLALTFDMGGTSCDVALVRDGAPARTSETVIAGHPLHLPMLDVATVSAGRRQHRLGRLRRRAARGSPLGRRAPRPGRLRARRHRSPTVTDANVVLGRLPPTRPSAARIRSTRRPRAMRSARWPPSSAWGWRTAPRASSRSRSRRWCGPCGS